MCAPAGGWSPHSLRGYPGAGIRGVANCAVTGAAPPVAASMRADLALHCLRLDMPFHKTHTPGELIERIDGDVNALANFFSEFVLRLLGNAILVVAILLLLFGEDARAGWGLTVYALIVVTALA